MSRGWPLRLRRGNFFYFKTLLSPFSFSEVDSNIKEFAYDISRAVGGIQNIYP
ncbi:MAG: hypothetical protein LBV77_06635 [Candidatus Adiutrix intracellularis]|nr:hypothetical protein [Candidatus Adiutrix intracellularis]